MYYKHGICLHGLSKRTVLDIKQEQIYIYLLNLGQLIKHLTLSHLLYTYITVCIIAKGTIFKTKTRVIKTSLLQHLTSHPFLICTVQGRRLISAPLGRLSRASRAIVLKNQTCSNLNNIKYTYAINFTQFCK